MQQEQRGRILGASLSIEDGQPVYCYRAIHGRVVHGTLLSVGFRRRMKCMQHDNNRSPRRHSRREYARRAFTLPRR